MFRKLREEEWDGGGGGGGGHLPTSLLEILFESFIVIHLTQLILVKETQNSEVKFRTAVLNHGPQGRI